MCMVRVVCVCVCVCGMYDLGLPIPSPRSDTSSISSSEEVVVVRPAIPPKPPKRAPIMMRKQQQAADEEAAKNEYGIINLTCLNDMINDSYIQHLNLNPTCKYPQFELIKTKQKFISLTLAIRCKNCNFDGAPKKMYIEMEKQLRTFNEAGGGSKTNRGGKASTLNASLSAALTNSMIGVTQIRRMLLEIGVDVGPASTLQNLNNQISHLTKKLAEKSMEKGIAEIIQQKEEGQTTHISQDGMYNNRKRPGPCQPGTQVVFTSVGSNGKVLAFQTFNKLCPKGKRLESKGLGSCREGHEGCTQTLDEVAPISQEGRMALEALFSLRERGYVPDYLAVDGDCQIRKKVEEFSAQCDNNVVVQYDPNHWAKSIERHLNKVAAFVDDGTFHGKYNNDTKKVRQSTMNKLCNDISNRCKSEIKACSNETEYITDNEARKTEMHRKFTKKLKSAIVHCIQGNCNSKCRDHSLVCQGLGKEESRKAMLGEHNELSGKNLRIAKERIETYFEKDRIAQVFMQIDTNINEAMHRGYGRTNPKTLSHSRNYFGRISREIIHFNEGIAVAAQMVNDEIGHKTCQTVKDKLEKEQKLKEYHTMYAKKESTSRRRFQRLHSLHKKHSKHQREKKSSIKKAPYRKHQDLTM